MRGAAFCLALVILAAAGCEPAQTATSQPAAASTRPGDPAASVDRAGFGPISFFEENCAQCHGPYGSFYGETFARGKSPEDLRHVIEEMTAGPANAPVSKPQLEALVDYHESLAGSRVYVLATGVRTDRESGRVTLRGEVMPGAKVSVRVGGQSIGADVNGHRWSVTLPAGTRLESAEIQAIRSDRPTTRPAGEMVPIQPSSRMPRSATAPEETA